MKFCSECGTKLDSKIKFCPECGTPVVDTKSSKQNKEETTDNYKTQVRGKSQSYGILNLENLPEGHIIDDRYEIKQKIGQGGFGAVYLVYDKNMNIDKALKIIPEAISSDKEAMFDLQNEAQTMIALNNPNIVRVYDFHKTGDIKFIDMEYIDGKTLTELKLEYKNKQIPEEQVRELALQIASGMSYAHQNGILHKDIKPQNVIVTKDNNVKIMDFGIAETVRTSMSRIQNSSSSGTLVYMSPEQIKGKDVGKESDIYSFGAMLYELLSGHPPFFKGDINYQVLNEKPEPFTHISDKMNELILKCLEKDYKDRFKNFGEVFKFLGGTKVKYSHNSLSNKQTITSTSKLKTLSTVSIKTDPDNADIVIGKKEYKTPFEDKLTIGTHQIYITKEGYKDINDELIISNNSSNDFYIELESLMGKITVDTDEPGLTIWLNGQQTDFLTPYTFSDIIPSKDYTFSVDCEKRYSEEYIVKIQNNENITIKPELVKYSYLSINNNHYEKYNGQFIFFRIADERLESGEIIRLKKGEYCVKPSFDILPEFKIVLEQNETQKINYDEIVSKHIIEIRTGKYDATISYKSKLCSKEFDLKPNKENEMFPGMGILRIKSTPYELTTAIDITTDNVKMDIERDINLSIAKKGKQKTRIICMISVFFLLLLSVIIVSIIKENNAWLIAKQNNTAESYNNYLTKHKNSKNSDRALKKYTEKVMVFVKGGSFQMGSNDGHIDQKPVHSVYVDDFYIGMHEVTNREWNDFMEHNFKNNNLPAEPVSWFGAVTYCNKKSIEAGLTPCYSGKRWNIKCNFNADGFRLPTEAEWEYAARGGIVSRDYKYSGSDDIEYVAWYRNNGGLPKPVGTKQPNELGIYDMSGNVWELCNDFHDRQYYSYSPRKNPQGPNSGDFHVMRGGSSSNYSFSNLVYHRGYEHSSIRNIGFRLVQRIK
jgi:serine/threonine protein kinase/formylglycine-generating enzyme required for sulfatase activity